MNNRNNTIVASSAVAIPLPVQRARRAVQLAVAATVMLTPTFALAADRQWTGGDGSWSTPASWADDTLPTAGDAVGLTADKPLKITFDVPATLSSLSLTTTGKSSITITGDATLTIADNGTISKAVNKPPVNHTIAVPVTLAGSATFSNDGTWTRLANLLIFQQPITGSGTVTIDGKGGGVALSGDNSKSFSGQIVVAGGALLAGHAGALGDTAQGTRLTGGKLIFAGDANTAEPFTIAGRAAWDAVGSSKQSGPIHLESKAIWILDDRNANGLTLLGAIDGPADANISITTANITLGGTAPNTFAGTIRHASRGGNKPENHELRLNKPAGVAAIAGPLELQNNAAIVWQADDQIADAAPVVLKGGVLEPRGHHESLGVLTLAGSAQLDFTDGGDLHFAASDKQPWKDKSQLVVNHWTGQSQKLSFGDGASGITADQVALIGFRDPQGKPAGLYFATMQDDGAIVPSDKAVVAVNPPYDVSEAARAERAKLYEIKGLEQLTAADTPLKKGMSISFFGDSITWQNRYITNIRKALESSAATKDLGITLHNHGINGGGALQIREGSKGAAFDGKTNKAPQAPFAEVIATDKSDIAVLFIGINDVWWRKTTPEDFRQQLTDIADAAKKHGTRLVVATMATHGERPDGSNKDDAKIEQFVTITREVAKAAGAPLVDLREAFIAYNRNNNGELQLDGSILSRASGFLTYDGVHPTATGNEVLANLIAQGIVEAAKE
jgi:lysophospholipase L1-like esterase